MKPGATLIYHQAPGSRTDQEDLILKDIGIRGDQLAVAW